MSLLDRYTAPNSSLWVRQLPKAFLFAFFFFALAAVVVVVAVQVAGTEFGRACPLDPVGRLSI